MLTLQLSNDTLCELRSENALARSRSFTEGHTARTAPASSRPYARAHWCSTDSTREISLAFTIAAAPAAAAGAMGAGYAVGDVVAPGDAASVSTTGAG